GGTPGTPAYHCLFLRFRPTSGASIVPTTLMGTTVPRPGFVKNGSTTRRKIDLNPPTAFEIVASICSSPWSASDRTLKLHRPLNETTAPGTSNDNDSTFMMPFVMANRPRTLLATFVGA